MILIRNWHRKIKFKAVHNLIFENIYFNVRINRKQFSCGIVFSQKLDQKVFFGHEIVSADEKTERVHSVFSRIAPKYDLMNDIMSIGTHHLMKDYLIHMLNPTPGTKLLDVAGGTGDVAIRFLQYTRNEENTSKQSEKELESPSSELINKSNISHSKSSAVVLDINKHMLSVCNAKAKSNGFEKDLTCVLGSAETLPFANDSFDAYTIAFGIRNVALMDEALSEAKRVLKKGGRFLCLEFSHVENPFLSRIYSMYSEVLPCLGQLVARDWSSYQYLVESIQKFPDQENFQSKIEKAGFSFVDYKNIFDGIAAIHSAYKVN